MQTMAGRSKKTAELDVIYLFEKGSARNSNEDSMVLSLRVDHVVKEAKNVEEAADDDKRGGHLRRAFCAALLTSMRLWCLLFRLPHHSFKKMSWANRPLYVLVP